MAKTRWSGTCGGPAAVRLVGPGPGQEELAVDQRVSPAGGIGGKHADHAVLGTARSSGILTLHPGGGRALRHETGAVEDQHPFIFPELIGDVFGGRHGRSRRSSGSSPGRYCSPPGMVQRLRPCAGGVQAHDGHVDALQGGLLVGEVPAGADGLADAGVDRLDRVRRADDPCGSRRRTARNGTNSAQAFSHSRTIAGYFSPQASANSTNRVGRGVLGRRGVDRLERLGDLVPVLAGRVPERVPQQVDHAGLHDRSRPDRRRPRRAGPSARRRRPCRTSSTPRFLISVSTCSQYLAPSPPSPAHRPRMSRVPVDGDRHGDVDRPVRDLPVPDLHVDRVDEHHRVDRVERAGSAIRPSRP